MFFRTLITLQLYKLSNNYCLFLLFSINTSSLFKFKSITVKKKYKNANTNTYHTYLYICHDNVGKYVNVFPIIGNKVYNPFLYLIINTNEQIDIKNHHIPTLHNNQSKIVYCVKKFLAKSKNTLL